MPDTPNQDPSSSPTAAATEAGGDTAVPTAAADWTRRIRTAQAACQVKGLSALLVSPGTDLFYLTGYEALPLERLTCLVIPEEQEPFLVVPELELPAAQASPVGGLALEVVAWAETEDPYAAIATRLAQPDTIAVDNHMWAEKVLGLLDAMPSASPALAGQALSELRAVKDEAEIAALRTAGQAIDGVHALVPQFLQAGRTEREIGADIATAIIEAGHESVDFVIVASGPNGASPHHDLSDRTVQAGEPVVVDIGGRMPGGYRSDCTRMYCIGQPPADFVDYYGILQEAQWQAVSAVKPGMSAQDLDAVGRDIITSAGFGPEFIHRTGHGIGLDTHEDPYIVSGNSEILRPGHVFSIEPGIYLKGRHGARIEDIVVCTDDGAEVLNRRSRAVEVVE